LSCTPSVPPAIVPKFATVPGAPSMCTAKSPATVARVAADAPLVTNSPAAR
jgi:hypothetical protein